VDASGPTLLRPRRGKWLLVALGSLVFVLAGASLGPSSWLDWLGISFFALGFLVSLASLLPRAAYLRLTPKGFTVCSLFVARTYRWEDVREFGVGRVLLWKMVMVNFVPSFPRSRALRSLNLKLCGFEGALPDNYGLAHEKLAGLLNEYKASVQGAA